MLKSRPWKTSAVSGGGGYLSSADILRTRREGDADVRTFWRKNLRIFWNLWCVCTDKGGWASISEMVIQSYRRHFAIFVTQVKCDAIIRCDNDLDQKNSIFLR